MRKTPRPNFRTLNRTEEDSDYLPASRLRATVRNRGFSLLVAVSLMVLMAMLVVGVLSLSSATLRSVKAGQSQAIARANAKLSLQLAIARLQELAGPDTRVTAPASAVSGVNGERQFCGVWRSWEGEDHTDRGLPVAPNYDSKLDDGSTIGSGTGKFLGWLVSGPDGENSATSPPSANPSGESVSLLAEGSLGSQLDDGVQLEPTLIKDVEGNLGSYAWWVQGENTKVRLKESESAADHDEMVEQMLVSPGPSGSEFDLEDTSEINLVISRRSFDLAGDEDTSDEFYHDLTPYSRGLLTNTANGGWRRDLSLLSENWGQVSEGFSSFTTRPGEVLTAGKSSQTGSSRSNPLLYPWTQWSGQSFPNSVSWGALVDYATQYRDIRTSGKEVALLTEVTNGNHQDWVDIAQRLPVLARVHSVVSLSAEPSQDGRFQPAIIMNPVVTLWNPYNVSLDLGRVSDFSLQLQLGSPIEITFECGREIAEVNLREFGNVRWLLPAKSTTGRGSSIWLPGEVRTFSPSGNATVLDGTDILRFVNGYSPGGGVRYPITKLSPQAGTVRLTATAAKNTFDLNLPNVKGSGFYFTHKRSTSGNQWQAPKTTNVQCALDIEDGRRMLGDEVTLTQASETLSSLVGGRSATEPFLSIVSSLRFGRDVNGHQNNIMVNGIHNMSPVVGYMVQGTDTTDASDIKGRFDVFPYNVHFFPVNGANSPGMPSGISGDPEGYLGGGYSFNDGLTNLVLLDVPTRPLRTLGGLQHFSVNACNWAAPYTLNAFGNSRASAFIASDKVQVSGVGSGSSGETIGHDHSYCINHLLVDDWFVSSIAPKMNAWSASEKRGIRETYAEHLSGEQALPHHYYKPAETVSDEDEVAREFLADSEAWKKVAAELVVEGMFNINSTSETAWAMLLKRSFHPESVSYLSLGSSTAGSGDANAQSVQSSGSSFPRNTLNSDLSGGAPGFSALAEPRDFTDQQIEALAREIVVEIKERGPFLSLSEFFNRQLSDDPALAHAGAVEAALLRLSKKSGGENPYSDLISIYSESASTTDVMGGTLDFPFPEAAEGNPAYGFPGWTRQADVLRPLSGVLSARDDTFVIRAYGDARDPRTNRIVSQAWCEAVVQRGAEYMDDSEASGDDKYTLPSEDTLNSSTNFRLGRRFNLVAFRWLKEEEV